MSFQKVRVGIIGTGGIAYHHAKGLDHHQDKIEAVAICDVNEEGLKKFDERLGGVANHFSDWKTMLSEMDKGLDAVIICLPHYLHAAAILDAAEAGKHILCEKPMCINLEEADTIVARVREAGIIYMSGHNQLFLPFLQEAKKLLDDGVIGQLHWIRSQDCFKSSTKPLVGQWRSKVELQGGGELIDTGYHPSYRLIYMAGNDIAAVRGTFGRFLQPIEGEDTASVQVRFASGVSGEVFTSWAFTQPYGTHQIHMIGSKGQLFGSGDKLYHLPEGATDPTLHKLSSTANDFVAQMEHFADCVREGQRPIHSVEEGRAVLEIILKATDDAEGWQKTAQLKN